MLFGSELSMHIWGVSWCKVEHQHNFSREKWPSRLNETGQPITDSFKPINWTRWNFLALLRMYSGCITTARGHHFSDQVSFNVTWETIFYKEQTKIVQSRPGGKSLSPCGRCREQNWTSKNKNWQDIDLLIAAVQTHRCEGQEKGDVVGCWWLSGFHVWKSEEKKGKAKIYQLIASPQFLSTFFICFTVKDIYFVKVNKKVCLIIGSAKWTALFKAIIDVVHQFSMFCNGKTQ